MNTNNALRNSTPNNNLKSASRSAPYQSPVESRRTVTFSSETSPNANHRQRSLSQDSIDFWGETTKDASDDGMLKH